MPKLNLQFLTAHDYLLRNFNLFRLEATYEIREDVADVLQRIGADRQVLKSTPCFKCMMEDTREAIVNYSTLVSSYHHLVVLMMTETCYKKVALQKSARNCLKCSTNLRYTASAIFIVHLQTKRHEKS